MLFAAIETLETIRSYFKEKRIFGRYNFLASDRKLNVSLPELTCFALVLAIKTQEILLVFLNKRNFIFVLWLGFF